MLTIFLILIPLCGFVAYCMCRHFQHTKEFNPLLFTLDKEVQDANKRQIKPCIEPQQIPKAHIKAYFRDWVLAILCIGAVSLVAYLIFNAI